MGDGGVVDMWAGWCWGGGGLKDVWHDQDAFNVQGRETEKVRESVGEGEKQAGHAWKPMSEESRGIVECEAI